MSYVLKKEEEITSLFEEILQRGIRDGTLTLDPSVVKLMAHNIMVLGQMWTFRRWSLKRLYTLEEYTRHQTALLLNQCINPNSGGEVTCQQRCIDREIPSGL